MVAEIYETLRLSLLTRAAELGFITTTQLREMPTEPMMVKGWTPSPIRPGRYLVRGRNPGDGDKYYGTAKVEKSDDEYIVTWKIGDQQLKGRGPFPRGDAVEVRILVEGKYEVIFLHASGFGIYEGTWGSGGIEELIPASPIMHHSRTKVG